MPASGQRGKGATKANKKPRISPLERYTRGRRIAEMRAREKPIAWREIGRVVGLSARQCVEIHAQFLEWEEPLHDPMEVVQETIDSLTVAMHEALRTYEAAPEGSSTRVQALRTAVDTSVTRLQVMRAAGRAPRSLAAPAVAQQVQVVFREFAELLRRHNVGDDVIRDFVLLAESQAGKMTAVEGRALPSAA